MSNFNRTEFENALGSKYYWPGGYEKIFRAHDGGTLCFECATQNRNLIGDAIDDHDNSGWRIIAVDVNWENDFVCDHCGRELLAEYTEGV